MRIKNVTKEESGTICVDGVSVPFLRGDTIASACMDAGIRIGRHSQKGEARNVFCGMGICFDCLTIIEDQGAARACMTPAIEGMKITSWPESGVSELKDLPALVQPPRDDLEKISCDVAVVGAGPAGLEAASTAAEAGLKVIILDERPELGGQYFARPKSFIETKKSGKGTVARESIAKVKSLGCEIYTAATIWRGSRDNDELELAIFHDGKTKYIKPKNIVIATGSYDIPLPVPGWTMPGVMTVGGVQSMMKRYGVLPKGPIVLCGNGPLLLQLASQLALAGVKVAAMVSASATPFDKGLEVMKMLGACPDLMVEGTGYMAVILAKRIPMINGHVVVEVEGGSDVTGVRIAPCDASGRPNFKKARVIEASTACLGYGFMPNSELARQLGCNYSEQEDSAKSGLWAKRGVDGQTNIKNVYVVGEAGGIGGGRVAICQGRLAGYRIAEIMTGKKTDENVFSATIKSLAKNISFQRNANEIYNTTVDPLNFVSDSTMICRCEEVTIADVKNAVKDGATTMGAVKRLTRIGMGRCQGRYCQQHLAKLLQKELGEAIAANNYFMPQPPLKPIPVSSLAVEKKEWAGHKRSNLNPISSVKPGLEKLGDEDIIVIGAGVAGCATAYYLGKEKKNCLVLDRGPVNGQASGGNAGSMHVQLLSFDYGDKAEGDGSAALKTLLLQRESAGIWRDLQTEMNMDFEAKTVGGLMVAETEADLAKLEKKTAKERSYGIDVEVIGASELQKLAPSLSKELAGASYCPEEGKINPLKGTQGLYLGARALGQRFATAEILHIEKRPEGFIIHTPEGWYRANKVVNAAGAWASQISGMVGTPVPVFGAPLQMIVTEAVAPSVSQLVAHVDRHLTMKQMKNGNFILGGGWTAGYSETTGYPSCLRDSLEGNCWVARRVIPGLDGVNIIRSWAAININIDGAPIVGEMPGVEGFYNTVTSNGYTLGPIMGKITSDLICHGETDHDIAGFTLARF